MNLLRACGSAEPLFPGYKEITCILVLVPHVTDPNSARTKASCSFFNFRACCE